MGLSSASVRGPAGEAVRLRGCEVCECWIWGRYRRIASTTHRDCFLATCTPLHPFRSSVRLSVCHAATPHGSPNPSADSEVGQCSVCARLRAARTHRGARRTRRPSGSASRESARHRSPWGSYLVRGAMRCCQLPLLFPAISGVVTIQCRLGKRTGPRPSPAHLAPEYVDRGRWRGEEGDAQLDSQLGG